MSVLPLALAVALGIWMCCERFRARRSRIAQVINIIELKNYKSRPK
jgi:hypothetical protein